MLPDPSAPLRFLPTSIQIPKSKIQNRLAWIPACAGMTEGRRAFTLIEILLVLGILVAVAAVGFNSMLGFRESQSLPRVADDFRGLFGDLRIRAMEEGRAYQFAFRPDTAEYRILAPGGQALSSQPTGPAPPRFDAVDIFGPRLLDEQLKFGRLESYEPATPSFVSELASQGWIVFQFEPDGSSDDVAFLVAEPTGSQIVLRVHGTTGRTTIEGPFRPTDTRATTAGART
jgi:prepilin-type N-terminal cleavage/methylation domain-containing protein